MVSFTPEMAHLYEAGHTLIDLEQRRSPGPQQLGKVAPWSLLKPCPALCLQGGNTLPAEQLNDQAHDRLLQKTRYAAFSLQPAGLYGLFPR